MARIPARVTRRDFLKAASLALPSSALQPAIASRETLYNGIVLPSPWPPRRDGAADRRRCGPYYLVDPPSAIDDRRRPAAVRRRLPDRRVGLFRALPPGDVSRRQPRAGAGARLGAARSVRRDDRHAAEPVGDGLQRRRVLRPGRSPVQDVVHGRLPAALRARRSRATASAGSGRRSTSCRGTNIVHTQRRDSNTVWLDLEAPIRPSATRWRRSRSTGARMRLSTSPDGIHWRAARGRRVRPATAARFLQPVPQGVGLQPARRARRRTQPLSPLRRVARLRGDALERGRRRCCGPAPIASTRRAPTARHARALQPRRGRLRKRAARPVHDLPRRAHRAREAERHLSRLQPRRVPLGSRRGASRSSASPSGKATGTGATCSPRAAAASSSATGSTST